MSESGNIPISANPVGAQTGAAAEFPPASPAQRGLFGAQGTGDTSGFGGLVRRRPAIVDAQRPFGGYFDEVYDALRDALGVATTGSGEASLDRPDAIEHVVVDRGELTLHVKPERIAEVCQVMRDDDALRFE